MSRNRERDGFVGLDTDVLAGAVLSRVDLRQAYLNHVDLTGAQLTRIDLRGAFLIGARLDGLRLHDASLVGTHLIGASLQGARITEVGAHFVRMDRADLRHSVFDGSLEHGELPGAWLQGADFSAADLRHTNLTGICYDGRTRWPQGADLPASGAAGSPPAPPLLTEQESTQVIATLAERAQRFSTRHTVADTDRFVLPLPGLTPVTLEELTLMASSGPAA